MTVRQGGGILFFVCFTSLLASCGGKAWEDEEAKTQYVLDQTQPELVVQAVFDVANGATAELLAVLCDPMGQNDLDTRRICDQAKGFDPEGEFAAYFKHGKLLEGPIVNGDTASIPFSFGPGKPKRKVMTLIQRQKKWYLLGF